jgi:hypothetical protein
MKASQKFIQDLLVDNTMKPLDKIYAMIDRFINKMMGEQNFQCIMSREQLNSEKSPVRDLIWELKREMLGLMQPIVTDAQEAGIFHKDIDVVMLMTSLFGTIHQIIPAQKLLRNDPEFRDLDEATFKENLKQRLSIHLKKLFKAILTHEF